MHKTCHPTWMWTVISMRRLHRPYHHLVTRTFHQDTKSRSHCPCLPSRRVVVDSSFRARGLDTRPVTTHVPAVNEQIEKYYPSCRRREIRATGQEEMVDDWTKFYWIWWLSKPSELSTRGCWKIKRSFFFQ